MNKISNFFTEDEQKVLFFLIIFGFLGIFLHITHLKAQEKKIDKEAFQDTVSKKVIMKYDIRTAKKSELTNLSGIGPARASDIIEYREKTNFTKSSDLMNIKGIGPRTYEKIKKNIVIFGEIEERNVDKENLKVTSKAQTQSVKINKKININTADVTELIKLKGIGKSKAKKIIEYRTNNGNFVTVEQLMDVKGIGKKTVQKNKERISLK
ncbi:MAG: ComEA family DNA-binding protein [Candidatus Cloacimonadota bacterium]|nr:ComEA family DNA-binding protein [Candidatus Cloacimonadota bacterium]